jgi:dGTPase
MTPKPVGHLTGLIFTPPAGRAAFATQAAQSRGRFHAEDESATRTCYQRDRDRIIHSTAFRRLKHKTQVFVQHEGDYYRTRLTHSLEVAQIARSLARVLAVDEDLAETVALAHDMGHTPFGHAGEETLSALTARIGGFDHNAHALRLVTKLEHRYADFDGLNLTWETLEGLVKHNGPLIGPRRPSQLDGAARASSSEASHAGEAGRRLPQPIASFNARWDLELARWPGIEAQIAALADDIAYVNHDIDDGLRAGLFMPGDLNAAPLAGAHAIAVEKRWPGLETGRFVGELIRTLMSALLDDLLSHTRAELARAAPQDTTSVRGAGRALVAFSPRMTAQLAALKEFLFAHMYRHPRVMVSMTRAQAVVTDLFEALCADPRFLPADWTASCGAAGDDATAGVVRDYIAGMTDSFALAEYGRIFHTEISL